MLFALIYDICILGWHQWNIPFMWISHCNLLAAARTVLIESTFSCKMHKLMRNSHYQFDIRWCHVKLQRKVKKVCIKWISESIVIHFSLFMWLFNVLLPAHFLSRVLHYLLISVINYVSSLLILSKLKSNGIVWREHGLFSIESFKTPNLPFL